ncbi:MAG: hypothetical protein RL336_1157 [Pseudomonadota bacterium]
MEILSGFLVASVTKLHEKIIPKETLLCNEWPVTFLWVTGRCELLPSELIYFGAFAFASRNA